MTDPSPTPDDTVVRGNLIALRAVLQAMMAELARHGRAGVTDDIYRQARAAIEHAVDQARSDAGSEEDRVFAAQIEAAAWEALDGTFAQI